MYTACRMVLKYVAVLLKRRYFVVLRPVKKILIIELCILFFWRVKIHFWSKIVSRKLKTPYRICCYKSILFWWRNGGNIGRKGKILIVELCVCSLENKKMSWWFIVVLDLFFRNDKIQMFSIKLYKILLWLCMELEVYFSWLRFIKCASGVFSFVC